MKKKSQKTLKSLFAHPVSANIKWQEIESLMLDLGAEILQREGSRVAFVWMDEVMVFHRPHPSPDTDKGAVVSLKKWLESKGVKP